MTEKLYDKDCYIMDFEAQVIDCKLCNEVYEVVLDRTAFFPEGGGQAADSGDMNGIEVIDVQEREGTVFHKVKTCIAIGTRVHGVINREERMSKMQQHSGEHIISGLIYKIYGYNNVGFHLGKEVVTMDFNGILSKEQLRDIEVRANEAVWLNIPIEISYPEQQQLDTLAYRSKIEIKEKIRIVTIQGYDVCACCAPHLKSTGEIGTIKLTSIQNYKNGVRINMLCGKRALADYIQKENNVKAISVLLSAKEDEVAQAVQHLKEEAGMLKMKMQGMQQQLLAYKASEIRESSKKIILFESELEGNAPRELVNMILKRGVGICAVFQGSDSTGYRYVIGSKTEDVRKYVKKLHEKLGGKGGGKSEMVQGSLNATKEMIEVQLCQE